MYFYGEMSGKLADGAIFDVYIDSDNSDATGLITSLFSRRGLRCIAGGTAAAQSEPHGAYPDGDVLS